MPNNFKKNLSVVLAYPAGLRGVANNDQSMAGSLQVLLLLTYIKKVFARTVA